MTRTLGIEEELLLVDPQTREITSRSHQVMKHRREQRGGQPTPGSLDASAELDQELFLHMLETHTDPVIDLDEGLRQVVVARRTAGEAARAAGAAAVAAATLPFNDGPARVTPDDRYRSIVDTFGGVGRTGGTCGMHVHVAVESDEEGVAVIDRIRPWLPVLLAVSANSPYADGTDSGYASWRAQVWGRWPTAGAAEPFGSVDRYREVAATLQEFGAALDAGMLYFDARLSAAHPTVEIRVADVCTDPQDTVLVAGLTRALVETAAREWREGQTPPQWRSDLLRAAHWRASKHGLAEALVHPLERELRPAREVLESLVRTVRPALEEAGDVATVEAGVERVLVAGGAVRQRSAFERGGDLSAVVDDLVWRTESSWSD
ncbi:carboxylate-amine ligase [Nocardioides pacificus]